MKTTSKFAWKARISVSLIMLILGFCGVIFTNFKTDGAWTYWRVVAVIYAALSLSLSFYLQKMGWKTTLVTVWHELFHWLGLILATFVTADFIDTGIMGRFQAGLAAMSLLALATYLAGVYIETTFIPVGIILGAFAASTALFAGYIYTVILPLTILAAIAVAAILYYHTHANDPGK